MHKMKAFLQKTKAHYLSLIMMFFSFMALPAFAGDTIDFSTLTGSISWTSVITSILGVAAGVALLYMAMAGAKHILAFIRRG